MIEMAENTLVLLLVAGFTSGLVVGGAMVFHIMNNAINKMLAEAGF